MKIFMKIVKNLFRVTTVYSTNSEMMDTKEEQYYWNIHLDVLLPTVLKPQDSFGEFYKKKS